MNAKQAYVLAKNFTKETAAQFGALKGAPAQILSVVKKDGQNIITFGWENDEGEKRETKVYVDDGTPIYTWEPNYQYEYGDLAIYHSAFYRCTVPNHDAEFDSTKWSEIGGAASQFDIVNSSADLPVRFTPADKRLFYSIEDAAFWLWDGYKWELQERSITNDEIDELFI